MWLYVLIVATPRTGVVGADIHSEPGVSRNIRILRCFPGPTHVVPELLGHTADCCCLACEAAHDGPRRAYLASSAWERSTAATRAALTLEPVDFLGYRRRYRLFIKPGVIGQTPPRPQRSHDPARPSLALRRHPLTQNPAPRPVPTLSASSSSCSRSSVTTFYLLVHNRGRQPPLSIRYRVHP
jgi:hypothetical protein